MSGITGSCRNKRDVWTIPTQPFSGAKCLADVVAVDHFAVFPEKLVEPCVLAGSRPGDVVLDPFCGAGTVGVVCERLGRDFIGIDLSQAYVDMARKRLAELQGMFGGKP